MVTLPTTPLRAPPNATPTPGVSPGQVAQPYEEFSSTLSTIGHEAGEIAKPLAREAGVRAVTRDPSGDLQIEHLPIIGPAADEFAKAAKWSYLAQNQAEARQKDLEISRQHQNDPDSYLKAATTFRDDYVAKATKTAGAEVGVELSRIIDSTTTQQYNSLLAQKQAVIRHNFDRDTSAIIKDAQVDLYTLIESGGLDTTTGRKQADDLIGRITNTYRARTGSILNAPPAETAIALKRFDEEVGASKFSADVRKILQADPEEGVDKALSVIDANFKDQSIPSSQRVANRDHALNTIKDFTQERVKAATLAARLQKQKDDLYEDAVIRSTVPGSEVEITENDVKKADISPAAKTKLLGFLKRDGMPEPLTRVSHETSMDLLRKIRSGEMGGNGAIYDAYDAGKLNRSDFNFALGEFEKLRTPEGQRLNTSKEQFFKAVGPTIDKSNPLMGKMDQDGKLQLYRFEWDLNQRMNEYRQAGKNPYDLLDPSKPDYMGKPDALLQYQKPLSESIRDMSNRLTGSRTAPTAAPPAPQRDQRKPGETPEQYLKRIGVK